MPAEPEPRDSARSLRRGLIGRCPNCGDGRMFDGYLALVERCAVCGEPLGEYRAADGPAFFTICIVGFLLVPMLGFGYALFRPDPLALLLATGIVISVLTLVVLRCVKGAFVAYLWSVHERDPGA